MREPQSEHAAYVDTWIGRLPPHLPPEQLVSAFEQGLSAMWRRAQRTLGDATVFAIVERVLQDTAEQVPLLATLKIDAETGVRFDEMRRRIRQEDAEELREGLRAILIQFLTVMGNLTAGVLTPALHVELSTIRIEELSRNGDGPPKHAPRVAREAKE